MHEFPMTISNILFVYFSGEMITSDTQRTLRHPHPHPHQRKIPTSFKPQIVPCAQEALDYQCSERKWVVVKIAFFHLLIYSFIHSSIYHLPYFTPNLGNGNSETNKSLGTPSLVGRKTLKQTIIKQCYNFNNGYLHTMQREDADLSVKGI